MTTTETSIGYQIGDFMRWHSMIELRWQEL